MCDIYRIVECHTGQLEEIAFVKGLNNAKRYLQTCYELTNFSPDVFYLAIKIQIEQ